MQLIPQFQLVAQAMSAEAAELEGFEWADPEVGKRHRLGGAPDGLSEDDYPRCSGCGETMSFYGQLDSIGDHVVLADAGVVLVFVCFDCFTATAKVQST
jgi:hypothetical protein